MKVIFNQLKCLLEGVYIGFKPLSKTLRAVTCAYIPKTDIVIDHVERYICTRFATDPEYIQLQGHDLHVYL